MNEAFGKFADLPFDLRSLRAPIRYTLSVEASKETRKLVSNNLVKDLVYAIRTILEKSVLPSAPQPPAVEETPPVWKSSSFLQDKELVARLTIQRQGQPSSFYWKNAPQAFLRLIPTTRAEWSPLKLRELIRTGPRTDSLLAFGHADTSAVERNKYGAVVFASHSPMDCLTQVFKNGEIWGIGKLQNLNPLPRHGLAIHSTWIEETFESRLKQYRQFAHDKLQLPFPFRFIAGLSEVDGFRMLQDNHSVSDYIGSSLRLFSRISL